MSSDGCYQIILCLSYASQTPMMNATTNQIHRIKQFMQKKDLLGLKQMSDDQYT